MSAAELSRFDELVSGYLDNALSAIDAAELVALLAEPALASRFLEMTRLNSEIAGLLAAPVPDAAMVELVRSDIEKSLTAAQTPSGEVRLRIVERTQPRTATQSTISLPRPMRRQRKPALRAMAWAAVFLILAALAGIYLSDVWRSAGKIEVAAVQGEVYFVDAAGQTRLTGVQRLSKAGKLKTVGKASTATLVLGDGTRVDVGGNSVLATPSAGGPPRLYLEDGSLKSQIARQPRDHPLTFATPEADAVVKGTALSLETAQHHTRLVVTEGRVLLKRRADGAEILVNAGSHVLVAPNAKLVASPNDPAPQHR